ncbi:MAG: hypothetical protein H6Q08_1177 [Acidobacteria bacterium]|nr:hypothetical protein [Acidobacteriota bacterium]
MTRTLALSLALIVFVVAVLAALVVLDVVELGAVRTTGGRVVSVILIATAAVAAISMLLRRAGRP